MTFGYLAGELFRRADGRTVGQALRRGLRRRSASTCGSACPRREDARVARCSGPPACPTSAPIDAIKRAAFLTPGLGARRARTAAWRRMEIPSANGHATAPALARLMAMLACDGGSTAGGAVAGRWRQAARQRIEGPDQVLPFTLSWGAGFLRNQGIGIYGPGDTASAIPAGAAAAPSPTRRRGSRRLCDEPPVRRT